MSQVSKQNKTRGLLKCSVKVEHKYVCFPFKNINVAYNVYRVRMTTLGFQFHNIFYIINKHIIAILDLLKTPLFSSMRQEVMQIKY